MSIVDGNSVNAAYTNTKLASKEDDNTLQGKQALTHNNVESGADILDIQKTVNDLVNILAIVGQGNTGSNVGAGPGEVFKEKIANDLRFRTLRGTNSVTVAINGDEIDLGHPIEFLAADPGVLVANTLWFNYTDKVWRFYDGVTTIEIGSDYVDLLTSQSVLGEKTWTNKAFFSDEVEITGKLTCLNDMEVQGTLTYINTTDLEVTDQNILVNKSGTDGSSEGAGVDVERPSGNAGIRFNSALDNQWEVGLISDLREVGAVIKGTKAALDALGTKYTSVLYYATDENLHYTWDGSSFNRLTMPSLATGGLITHNGTNYVALAVGADGTILKADSGSSEGAKYEEITIENTDANIVALARIKGQSYYATDTQIYYYDTGASLVPIGGSGFSGGVPISNKGDIVTHNASSISTLAVGSNGTRLVSDSADPNGIKWKANVLFALKATITALPRTLGEFYYATDESIFYGDDGVALVALGGTGLIGGGGGMSPIAAINLVANGTYNVGAGNLADITITQTNATVTSAVKMVVYGGQAIQIIKDATSGRVLVNGAVIAELDTATYAVTGVEFA